MTTPDDREQARKLCPIHCNDKPPLTWMQPFCKCDAIARAFSEVRAKAADERDLEWRKAWRKKYDPTQPSDGPYAPFSDAFTPELFTDVCVTPALSEARASGRREMAKRAAAITAQHWCQRLPDGQYHCSCISVRDALLRALIEPVGVASYGSEVVTLKDGSQRLMATPSPAEPTPEARDFSAGCHDRCGVNTFHYVPEDCSIAAPKEPTPSAPAAPCYWRDDGSAFHPFSCREGYKRCGLREDAKPSSETPSEEAGE